MLYTCQCTSYSTLKAGNFHGSNFSTVLQLQRTIKIQPDKIFTSLFVQQFYLLSIYMLFEGFRDGHIWPNFHSEPSMCVCVCVHMRVWDMIIMY